MGKASNRKQQARAQLRDRPELIEKIREQVQLLDILGEQFDAGHRVVGYPLATVVRVLVHDTAQSHALLAQVGELTTTKFLDTSAPINPRNLISDFGLVVMQMTIGKGNEWVPRCAAPSFPVATPRDVAFTSWWGTDVMKDAKGRTWSRRGMVLAIANKEGGAHIDPQQPIDIRAIEVENSMGWKYVDPVKGDVPMREGPLLPSIREIAYELEHSIARGLGAELDFTPSTRLPTVPASS